MPLEKGKLIRQLSLVAFLMSLNRPITARDVRECVEGYSEMSDDAFARRFYADRHELLGLGVPLRSTRDDDTGEELYTLDQRSYFLPALDLTDPEISALHTCLALLDGQFAYAEPLRLALQNLALGRENPATDPALASATVRLVGSDYSPEIASKIAKLETAISKRRTITFRYYTIARDEEEERTVNPYTLIWNGGQWYLVGYSHEREDVRVFRLTRVRGDIRFISRRERDFDVPEDFDPSSYRNRAPWQLGSLADEAELWLDPSVAWWVARSFGHAGEITEHADGSATFHTKFDSVRHLSAWICGMGGLVRPLGPARLAEDVRESLEAIAREHEGAAPQLPELAPVVVDEDAATPRRRQSDTPVTAEQFALLQALMADLLASCGDDRYGSLPKQTVMDRYALDDRELQDAISLLSLVNFGAGAYTMYAEIAGDQINVETEPEGEVFRRAARLSPLEAKALLLALDFVGPLVAATASSDIDSVRAKLEDAFGGYERPSIPTERSSDEDQSILGALTTGMREHKLVRIEYYSHNRGELSTREIEGYAVQRLKSHWYVVAWCRKADDVRSFRLDRVKSAELLDASFAPREIDLSHHVADAPLSAVDSPRTAQVWFAPEVARWITEDQHSATRRVDGSAVVQVAAATEQWLIEEILKYRGLATIVAPAELRERVSERAAHLAEAVADAPVVA